MKILEQKQLGPYRLQNRIIRSATYEGMCDEKGFPSEKYKHLYIELAQNNVGAIITGFAFISRDGKAMQPGQAGMDIEEKIYFFREITDKVHACGTKIFMQLAHAGRQTTPKATGGDVWGVSNKKSLYFRGKPRQLTTEHALSIAKQFGRSARFCRQAGFDGIQIHAAHGYLIHQFLLPTINDRKDIFAVNQETRIGTAFLEKVIDNIREECGNDFPILVKISGSDDLKPSFSCDKLISLIRFLDHKKVAAIEISYGTMENALNIFRGEVPTDTILKVNPFFKSNNKIKKLINRNILIPLFKRRLKPFTPMYNIEYAKTAKQHTSIPIISVGGFRTADEMNSAVAEGLTDFVGLSRPLICEPDLVNRIVNNPSWTSACTNCNTCAVMCDSEYPTRCYYKGKNNGR